VRWVPALLLGLGWSFAAAGATLHVGAGHRFGLPSQAIAAAHDGDTVAIDPGLYKDCAIVRRNRLTIRGTGPGVVLADVSCAGKGILVIDANDVTVAGLTLRGAVVPDGNGSGIRAEGGDLAVKDVRFIQDQDGILVALNPHATIQVVDSTFIHDGSCAAAGGCAHGIYAGRIMELDVEHSRFLDIKEGHNIKSRAALTVVENCTIKDGPNGTSSYQIDLPNGGNLRADGNMLEKGPKSGNPATAIMIGEEGVTQPTQMIIIRNNTLVNDTGTNTTLVHDLTTTRPTLSGNVLIGGKITAVEGGWLGALVFSLALDIERITLRTIHIGRVGFWLLRHDPRQALARARALL